MNLTVKLQRKSLEAKLPTKGTVGSAYYDLYAAGSYFVPSGEVRLVSTGWNIEVPKGWFLDIRPRSGLATKGITINNAPGTVDEDYRGELLIIVMNHSSTGYLVSSGDRVSQCALMPVIQSDFVECSYLTKTKRGKGGYGSTGK